MGRVFAFQTVVHLVQPSGPPVHGLLELRDRVRDADPATLFHLTHESLLRDASTEERVPSMLSEWCQHVLLENEGAERLDMVAEACGRGLEECRRGLLEVLDDLCRRGTARATAPEGLGFRMHRWNTLTLFSGMESTDPNHALQAVAALGPMQFFHHFYEAPALQPGSAGDILSWLEESGAARRAAAADRILSGASSLSQARSKILRAWRRSSIAGRVAGKADLNEVARRDESRQVVSQLVREWRKGSGSR
jgi:hypothetical protein